MEQLTGKLVIDKSLRYEKKFLSSLKYQGYLDRVLKFISSGIYETYPTRRVNSVYYDTDDLILALQNIEGYKERLKVRIRYYGDILGKNPVSLELKIKHGDVGTKEIETLKNQNSLDLNFDTYFKKKSSSITNQKIILICQGIKPKLFCSYNRNYYQTYCGNYRFTLDSDIRFSSFIGKSKVKDLGPLTHNTDLEILELKYSILNDNNASLITRGLPLRVTKISKYLTGLNKIGILNYN